MLLASLKYSTFVRISVMVGVVFFSSACAKKETHTAVRAASSSFSCIGAASFCKHKTAKVYPVT